MDRRRSRLLGVLALAALLAAVAALALGPCGLAREPVPRDSGVRAAEGEPSEHAGRAGAPPGDGDEGGEFSPADSSWCGTGRDREPDRWIDEAFRVLVRDAGTHAPLAGAIVLAIPDHGGAPEPRLALTGADGIATVPRWTGSSRYVVRHRGHLSVRDEDLARDARLDPPKVVELAPGVPLAGRVMREDGSPIAGAMVVAWSGRSWESEFDHPLSTDASGAFEIAGVPPDATVRVLASKPGFAPRTGESVAADVRAPLTIVLGGGSSIEGVVRDLNGAPVADADVVLLPSGAKQRAAREDEDRDDRIKAALGNAHQVLAVPRAITAADGSWRISGFATEELWDVYARSPAGDEGRIQGVESAPFASRQIVDVYLVVAPLGAVTVHLELPDSRRLGDDEYLVATLDADHTEVVYEHSQRIEDGTATFERVFPGLHFVHLDFDGFLPLRSRVKVGFGGRVDVFARPARGLSIRGRVLDAAGSPIGEEVSIQVTSTPILGVELSTRGMAAPDGTFEIGGAVGCPGSMRVSAPGFVPLERDGVIGGADVGTITLARAPIVRLRVPEAYRGRSIEVGHRSPSSGSTSDSTPEDGVLTEQVLPDEPTRIHVKLKGLAPFVRDVTLRPGEVLDLGEIAFPESVAVEGVVADADGAPVRGAEVNCTEWWSEDRVTTDAQGRFRFDHLVPLASAFTVEASGHPKHWFEVVPGAAGGPVTFKITKGGVLRGRIVLSADRTLPRESHVDAWALGPDGKQSEWKYFEFDYTTLGAFETRLPPGRYAVGFHRGNPPTEPVTVTIAEGGTTEVELRMR